MSQIFDKSGACLPVTAIFVGDQVICALKDINEKKYAIFGIGNKKNVKKVEKNLYKGIEVNPAFVKQFELVNDMSLEVGNYDILDSVSVDQEIDVTGVTKGQGFQGVMKAHGMKGGPKTHGQSTKPRSVGSIAPGQTYGHVMKGRRMARKTGNFNMTVKNLKVVAIDKDSKTIYVKGAVPGVVGGYVSLKFDKYEK